MPASPTSEPEYAFLCDCEEQMRSACEGEIFYAGHNGRRYCVLHFPGGKSKFWEALYRKLDRNDLDFRGVWFPGPWPSENVHFATDANFNSANFEGEVDFEGASFDGDADFSGATFKGGAHFSDVTFKSVDFSGTTFRHGGSFVRSTFAMTNFRHAHFDGQGNFVHSTFERDTDFLGVTFGQEALVDCVDFRGATFCGRVEFGLAKFMSAATFRETIFEGVVDFSNGLFVGAADFRYANFNPVTFMHSVFKSDANFESATFNGLTSFHAASFNGEVSFRHVIFGAEAYFGNAIFRDYVKFSGDELRPMFSVNSLLDLQFAKIEHPDQVSFQTVTVRPHWFVNLNTREFDLLDVKYRFEFEDEIKSLKSRSIPSAYVRLSKTFRDLAINCEDNHRYQEASRFRYWAMDTLRRKRWRGFPLSTLAWWYWLASGYGERAGKAFLVLFGILLLCGAMYTKVGFSRWEPKPASEDDVAITKRGQIGAPLRFDRALTYSLGVMTLQKPEPRPATTTAQTVVLFETILGPVQAALLALALRRKFMR